MPTATARLLAPLLPALVVLVAACKSPSLPVVYRIDVQQGNVITQDMLDQLEPGMDKRKVRFILGTPLIQDSFNPDRWDYYYSYQDRRKDRSARRVTLWFEQGRLAKVDGHVLLAEGRREAAPRGDQMVVVPERRDPGIFAALTPPFLKRDKREASLERSTPEEAEAAARERREEQLAAAEPAEETAPAAPAADGVSEAQVREETEYFQRLFQGYGREPSEVESLIPQAEPEPVPDPVAEPAPGPAPEETAGESREPSAEEVAAGEASAPEASEEEKGFFSRMVDRLRRERTGEESEGGEAESNSAPAPRVELPGEED